MRTLLRRLRAWLHRPVGDAPGPEELVELTRFPRRIDAEDAVQRLARDGVSAVLLGADAEGWAPHLGAVQGNRVMVRFRDLERAATVLGGE